MDSICTCPPSVEAPPEASFPPNISAAAVGDLVVHPHADEPAAAKPSSDHTPMVTHLALEPVDAPSSGGPSDKSKSIGAIVDVVPTDGTDITRLPLAVKRYTERDDFYPSATEAKSNLYGAFRAMHNKQDDKRSANIVTIPPNNPVHVSYIPLNVGPLHIQNKTW